LFGDSAGLGETGKMVAGVEPKGGGGTALVPCSGEGNGARGVGV
jgi:hypothetical protein